MAAIRYVYHLPRSDPDSEQVAKVISEAAFSITYLGQGMDMVTANATMVDGTVVSQLAGERWTPATGGAFRLRTPQSGTLQGLIRRHQSYLNRIGPEGFTPVARLSEFDMVDYKSTFAPQCATVRDFRSIE